MENAVLTDEDENRLTEIARQPDVIASSEPSDVEPVDPNIIVNLDQPLGDERFLLGIESVSLWPM